MSRKYSLSANFSSLVGCKTIDTHLPLRHDLADISSWSESGDLSEGRLRWLVTTTHETMLPATTGRWIRNGAQMG